MSTIKFSKRTLAALDNFASLNPACCLEKGNVIRTATATKTMLAIVKIDETIPEEFRIHSLPQFLSLIKMPIFNECDITITSQKTFISNEKASQEFTAAAASLVSLPPASWKPEHTEVTFQGSLTSENLSHILQVAKTLKHDIIRFNSKDGSLSLTTHQSDDKEGANSHRLNIGKTTVEGHHKLEIKTENLKLLETDYSFFCGLDSRGAQTLILKSQDEEESITYMIGAEIED